MQVSCQLKPFRRLLTHTLCGAPTLQRCSKQLPLWQDKSYRDLQEPGQYALYKNVVQEQSIGGSTICICEGPLARLAYIKANLHRSEFHNACKLIFYPETEIVHLQCVF